MRLCMFGDSIARGVIYDEQKAKYVFLNDCFASLVSQQEHLEIKNYARFGCTVDKAFQLVQRYEAELCRQDCVALELGGNDCDFRWAEVAQAPRRPHLPATPPEEFAREYTRLVEELSLRVNRLVVLNLPPLDAGRFFAWISRGLDRERILEFLGGDIHYTYRWHEMYNMQIQQIARKCSVPLIDIRSEFLKRPDYAKNLCVDGMHPNAGGHQLITAAIERAIPSLPFNG